MYFCDNSAVKTVDAYNKWAKDKMLSKDVIIHSHTAINVTQGWGTLLIVVFFDEILHPTWVGKDDTETPTGQP